MCNCILVSGLPFWVLFLYCHLFILYPTLLMFRNLCKNRFSGPVPAEFGNLRSIQVMWVSWGMDVATSILFHSCQLREVSSSLDLLTEVYLQCAFLIVIYHTTSCQVKFRGNWVNSKILLLCKFCLLCRTFFFFCILFDHNYCDFCVECDGLWVDGAHNACSRLFHV